MPTTFPVGEPPIRALARALGLGELPLQKLVIEVDGNRMPVVYVRGVALPARANALAQVIEAMRSRWLPVVSVPPEKDLQVTSEANVAVVPAPPHTEG